MITAEKLKGWARELDRSRGSVLSAEGVPVSACNVAIVEDVVADIERAIADLYREEAHR